MLFAFSSIHAQDPPRRVAFLHSSSYAGGTAIISEAARKQLLERVPELLINADFLDLAAEPENEQRLADSLGEKYSRAPPDIIMTVGAEALPFLLRHRNAIAPNVPVVFTGVSPATYASSHPPPDVTGVLLELDLGKTLSLAERLQLNARQLVVIAGSSATDKRWQATARDVVASRNRKFETSYLFDLSYDELMTELSRVPRDAIVVFLSLFADETGQTFGSAAAAAAVAARSPAPVYSPYSTVLGSGIVGGFGGTFESNGIAAADLIMEILAGRDPAEIAPRTDPGHAYRVDFTVMQRWNLRERNLPPGTIVLFKPPGIWDQHRDLVLAALCIFVLQTAFAGALLIQRRRRQRAEALLKESEERMTFTAASVNVGLWQFDRSTDELWATEHCRAIFGLGKDVPLTRDTLLASIHPEDRMTAEGWLQGTASADRSSARDVRVILPGDDVRWVRIRTRSSVEGRDTPNRRGGIFIDITQQKTAEAEAELQRQEVAHLMRVSVLGELSGAIAHEINQPLTAILSNAQVALCLLDDDSPDMAEVRDVVQDIVHEDNRASAVIHRLRKLLKKGEKKFETVDINDVVQTTFALLNSELVNRRINTAFHLAVPLPATSGDPIQLQQVLLNLVMNAMDAMASTPVSERLITVSTREGCNGALEVLVKDNGSGIRPEDRTGLFKPFHTTKSHGLGLGLAICSTIVHAHDGQLALVNDESGGACRAALIAGPQDARRARSVVISRSTLSQAKVALRIGNQRLGAVVRGAVPGAFGEFPSVRPKSISRQ